MSTKKTLSDFTQLYEQKGYNKRFKLTENGLKCIDSNKIYNPKEFNISNVHRFDGMTSVGDESVLYVIEADNSSTKGLLIDAYGAYSDSLSFEMLEKLRYDPTQ